MVSFIAQKESSYKNVDGLSKMACVVPFRHIEIHSRGQVSICCHTWLPQWCGNLLTDTPEEVLSNIKMKEIQHDMRDGKFSYCNDLCPQLSTYLNKGLDGPNTWAIVPKEFIDLKIQNTQYQVYFSYDPSCNLQCPSCRKGLIVHRPDDPEDKEAARISLVHEKVKRIVELLLEEGHKVQLSITGSGDPFASPLYWQYLKDLASKELSLNLKIILQTNGVMMTEKSWLEIKPLWKHIDFLNISVDAAREETYKIVRKNGNFTKLKMNLDYLDSMIIAGNLPNLEGWQSNFIVQKDNFREIKEFVEWQLGYTSLTKIWTNLIAQWHHMSDEEFKDMAIWQDENPMQAELIEILKDPIFKNPKIKLGNMSSLVPKD